MCCLCRWRNNAGVSEQGQQALAMINMIILYRSEASPTIWSCSMSHAMQI